MKRILAKLIKNLPRIMMIVFIIGAFVGSGFLVMKVHNLEEVVLSQGQTIQELESALNELSDKAETAKVHLGQVEEQMDNLAQRQAAIQQAVAEFSDPMGRQIKVPQNASREMRMIAEFLPRLPNDCGVYDGEGIPLNVPIVAIGYFESENKQLSSIVVANHEWYFTSPSFWKKQKGWESAPPYAAKIVLTCSDDWTAYFLAHQVVDRLSRVAYPLQPKEKLTIEGIIVVPHGHGVKWHKFLGANGEIIEEAEVEP
jgi:uncharacterized membrane-anchored protein YhcB (DUF1043 family)